MTVLDNDIVEKIKQASEIIHKENEKWWHDIHTGERTEKNIPEMLALVHSEVSEALEGYRKNLNDDKLPNRSMLEVELADTIIRVLDMSAGLNLDVASAMEEKLYYNRNLEDHKI